MPSVTELVVKAVQAALPDDLLARADVDGQIRAQAARARGSGAVVESARRGRPVGSRPGALRSGARLNLVDTFRAAPRLGRGFVQRPPTWPVLVRPSDFRVRRFVQRAQSTTIFAVDASGSTAFQRLSEAKGAVELCWQRPMCRAPVWRWSLFAETGPKSCCRPPVR